MSFLPGYCLQRGSGLDRALLVKVMRRTHSEISPGQSLSHVSATVDQHFSSETPLWWVYADKPGEESQRDSPVACLWLGNAVDQRSGERHAYVLLLFVEPAHRRRGLATALLEQGQRWAQQRGDRQIALQVLSSNEAALKLYQKLGYTPASVLMTRSLD
ncbi:MAG: GNAT family N-acetyltransferase [Cyanobacteria bacterium Co-bin13]|nr:GNAT family N-acetyltransferase [Cyanobacteria bacterium Co-bin13]